MLGDKQQDSQNSTASSSCSRSERTNQESAQGTILCPTTVMEGGRLDPSIGGHYLFPVTVIGGVGGGRTGPQHRDHSLCPATVMRGRERAELQKSEAFIL